MDGNYNDTIDHTNSIKDDNSLDNLEVVTPGENTIRATGKSVNQCNLETEKIINTFKCISDAYKSLGKSNGGSISECCIGKRHMDLYGSYSL